MLKLRTVTLVLVFLISLFPNADIYSQGLSDNSNFNRFKPTASIFIQPSNVFGYYSRMNLGMAFIVPNGLNVSLMTAIKYFGPARADHYTVREWRPEVSYFLLKPYYKVNLRVGLELLFTKITERRIDNFYLTKSQKEVYYSTATLIEKRKGVRIIVAMVLASSRSFVFEPYIGVGYALRSFEYSNVNVSNPPAASLSLQKAFEGFNLLDTGEKYREGSRYYFMPTVGLKLGLRF